MTVPLDWDVYRAEMPAPWPDAYRVTLRMIKETANLAVRNQGKSLVMTIGASATVEDRRPEAMAPYPDARLLRWEFDRHFREITALAEQFGFDGINLVEPFRLDYGTHKASHSWAYDGHWKCARASAGGRGRLFILARAPHDIELRTASLSSVMFWNWSCAVWQPRRLTCQVLD